MRSTPRGEPSRTLGSFPTPASGGLCRPEFRPGARHLVRAAVSQAGQRTSFAARGGRAIRTMPDIGVLPCRPPSAGCAGLKVGVPGLACHVPNGRLAHRAGSTVVVAARVTRTERAAYSEAQAHRTRGPGEPVEARVADMFAVRELETDVRDALGPGYSSLNWID